MAFFRDVVPLGCLLFSMILWVWTSKEDENIALRGTIRKFFQYVEGIIFMCTSKDAKGIGKKLEDPDMINKCSNITSKRLVFVRHGESDWNDVFNKGFGPSIFLRIGKAMYREFLIYHTSDSIFLDSPLNKDGFSQALELGRYIETSADKKDDESLNKINDVLTALRGDVGPDGKQIVSSVMVTSNLRRSIATVICCAWKRLMRTNEKIHIFSGLQEISLNVDTKALSEPQGIPDIRRIQEYVPEYKADEPHLYLDPTVNHGNKTTAFNGLKRLKAFNEWVFNRDEEVIIASGHSLWFKYYFLTYLSHGSTHDAMCTKIVNGGAVACVVHRGTMTNADGTTTTCYKVEEDSIVPVYGGFEKKKK